MIVLAVIDWRERRLFAHWKKYALTVPGSTGSPLMPAAIRTGPLRFRRRTSGPIRSFSRLSTHALITVLVFFIMWVSLLAATTLQYRVPFGLPLRIARPGVNMARPLGIQPVLLRVAKNSQLYVGSELTSAQDLSTRLKQELSRRPPDWPVYVIAAPELEWRQVAEVIDAVRGEGADVILVRAPAGAQAAQSPHGLVTLSPFH